MNLTKLQAQNFRCIESAELSLHSAINYIVGENGAGKTSLLEAIYLLGTGQSKRNDGRKLIRDGQESCVAYAEGALANGSTVRIGAARNRHGTVLKMNGEEATRTEVVSTIPMLYVDPNLHALVEEGPEERRRFLDWGVFHVEHRFLITWRRYRRLLRQRNAALNRGGEEVFAWDQQLEAEAVLIDDMRRAYIDELESVIDDVAQEIFPDASVAVEYRRGWSIEDSLGQVLYRQRELDLDQGYTRSGPQRADLKVKLSGENTRHRLSRGEQKLLSMIMTIAQIRLHLQKNNEPPVLLLDDLAAELSPGRYEQVIALLGNTGVQIVITSIDPNPCTAVKHRMFHVEHGVINS